MNSPTHKDVFRMEKKKKKILGDVIAHCYKMLQVENQY